MALPAASSILFIPWSQDSEGLKGQLNPAYQAGFDTGEPHPKSHDAFWFRQGAKGNFYLVDAWGGPEITIVSKEGSILGKSPLPPKTHLVDFAVVNGGYILLKKFKGIVLERIEMDGTIQWSRSISSEELEDADQILWNGKRLFLTSGRSQADLLEINIKSGDIRDKIVRNIGGAPSVLLSDNRVLTVAYFPDLRKRGISVYNLKSGTENSKPFGDEWYGALATSLGADDQERVIMYTIPAFGAENGLARITPDGAMDKRLNGNGFVADPQNRVVYAGREENGQLMVQPLGNSGAKSSWQVPVPISDEKEGRFEYGGPQENGAHVFYFRDGNGQYKAALHCQSSGQVEVTNWTGSEVITRMQPTSTWQVQGNGSVLIPVSSSEGLSILKVDF